MPPASLRAAPPSPPIRPARQQGSAEVLQDWRSRSQGLHGSLCGYTRQVAFLRASCHAIKRREDIPERRCHRLPPQYSPSPFNMFVYTAFRMIK